MVPVLLSNFILVRLATLSAAQINLEAKSVSDDGV
jgi:hypothetical protein